jgi:small subunit ribosomal protein S20
VAEPVRGHRQTTDSVDLRTIAGYARAFPDGPVVRRARLAIHPLAVTVERQDQTQRTEMANTPQAKKRIRRNERRAEINGNRISRIRTFVKKVESAIEGGDKTVALAALTEMQPELARGVARGVLHKNTASRKLSRLSKRVASL